MENNKNRIWRWFSLLRRWAAYIKRHLADKVRLLQIKGLFKYNNHQIFQLIRIHGIYICIYIHIKVCALYYPDVHFSDKVIRDRYFNSIMNLNQIVLQYTVTLNVMITYRSCPVCLGVSSAITMTFIYWTRFITLTTYARAFGTCLLFLPLISTSFKYQEEKYNKNDHNKYIVYWRTNSSSNQTYTRNNKNYFSNVIVW